jgi:hypothetical protein
VALNKSLPLAVLIGCFAGGLVYWYLLSDWFFAIGITAIYIGIGYFSLKYDVTLLGEQFIFQDTYDRLGHTIGLFGVGIGPLALIEYVDFQLPETAGVLTLTTGIVAYFVIISAAQSQQSK